MISRRSLEAATAVLTGAFGAAVVVSSIENGIGWSRGGVDAGTFPFLTGLVILAGSLFNLAHGWIQGEAIIIGRADIRKLAVLFLPAAAFIAAIPLCGIYVASGSYMLGTLVWQSHVPIVRAGVVAIVTAAALYLVFERMFQVSLPHGVLGSALGF